MWQENLLLQQRCRKLPHLFSWHHALDATISFVGIASRNKRQNRREKTICGDSLFQQHLLRGMFPSVAIANCCDTLWQQLLSSWV
jgi:hypothetical protein